MSNKYNKANISRIIFNELKQHKDDTNTNKYYEYGTVISVKDGVVQAYGLLNVQAGELVEFVDSTVKGLVLNLEKNSVGIIIFGNDSEGSIELNLIYIFENISIVLIETSTRRSLFYMIGGKSPFKLVSTGINTGGLIKPFKGSVVCFGRDIFNSCRIASYGNNALAMLRWLAIRENSSTNFHFKPMADYLIEGDIKVTSVFGSFTTSPVRKINSIVLPTAGFGYRTHMNDSKKGHDISALEKIKIANDNLVVYDTNIIGYDANKDTYSSMLDIIKNASINGVVNSSENISIGSFVDTEKNRNQVSVDSKSFRSDVNYTKDGRFGDGTIVGPNDKQNTQHIDISVSFNFVSLSDSSSMFVEESKVDWQNKLDCNVVSSLNSESSKLESFMSLPIGNYVVDKLSKFCFVNVFIISDEVFAKYPDILETISTTYSEHGNSVFVSQGDFSNNSKEFSKDIFVHSRSDFIAYTSKFFKVPLLSELVAKFPIDKSNFLEQMTKGDPFDVLSFFLQIHNNK